MTIICKCGTEIEIAEAVPFRVTCLKCGEKWTVAAEYVAADGTVAKRKTPEQQENK